MISHLLKQWSTSHYAQCEESDTSKLAKDPKQLSRKAKKEQERAQLEQEEEEYMEASKRQMMSFMKSQRAQVQKDNKQREEYLSKYKDKMELNKKKYVMSSRHRNKNISEIISETGQYSWKFLFLKTNDEVLYKYKRRLQKEIQWVLLQLQLLPVAFGAGLYYLTRQLKHKAPTDMIYFIAGYLFVNYGLFLAEQYKLFEIGYPAHPLIQEKRTNVLNAICYHYPHSLKNEIEFLHKKIGDAGGERYEKIFTAGDKDPKQFKVVVEEGTVYLQCLDKFEEVFLLSQETAEEVGLIEVLDPYLFENHKDIVNSLFEVYYDLATEYCQKLYYEKEKHTLEKEALKKVRNKYGLEQGEEEVRDFVRSLKK